MKPTGIWMAAISLLFMLALAGCGGGGNDSSHAAPPSLSSLVITPTDAFIAPGATIQFAATGTFSDGTARDLTTSSTWTSSNTSVATVDAAGRATAISVGSTTVATISEGVSADTTLSVLDSAGESPFGLHPAGIFKDGYTNNGYDDAQDIGVKWTRPGIYAFWFVVQPDLTRQEYDFSQYDQQWSAVPAGIAILPSIAPQGDIDEGYALTGSYMPVDTEKYATFVKAMVERYDGDGIDDMPGLANPVRYWQVGNEPNSAKSGFADLQRITYTAIKEACPDCKVIIGGVGGMPPVDQYIAGFDQGFKPILDSLGGQYVDIMDFHWYGDASGDYLGMKDAYDHIRSVLAADGFPADLPVWITEMGAYSGDPVPVDKLPFDYPPQSERQHALDYFKRFVYPLSFGVEKVFAAFGLMEGFKYDDGYFDHTGLIYDGWGAGDPGFGVKKLGYYTYRKMTEVLEGSDWDAIEVIRESENVYVCKFVKNGKPVHVAWWDYFNESTFAPGNTKEIIITGMQGTAAIVTEVVPKFDAGAEVTEYSAAFNTNTLTVSNGTVTLSLGESPVLVEELQ